MSWLPQDKLTTEEKEKLKVLQQRKDSLIGKYHTQIKSQTTTHETWLNTFITDNTKKRVQKCKDYHEKKIDKVELTLDDLQAYAIYSTAINTFKETKDNVVKCSRFYFYFNLEMITKYLVELYNLFSALMLPAQGPKRECCVNKI